jgi:hypothetical protein
MAESDWIDDDQGEWVDDKPKEGPVNPVMSAIRQGVQGASGNFSDEIAGGVEAAGRALGVQGAGGPMKDISISDDGPTLDWEILKDAYKRARDKERAGLKKDTEDNPGVSMAANIAGSVASPINKVAKGLSLAKGGAVLGGITGLGGSDAEDAGGMLLDTGMGVGMGLASGKAVDMASPYVGKAANWVGEKAKGGAEWLGARALGAERGTIKSMGASKVKDAGRYALDNGLLGLRDSTEDMISKNDALKQKGGEMMGKAYQAIDDAGASTFSPLAAADEVESKLGDFYRSPINRGESNQLENTLESIRMRAPAPMPVESVERLPVGGGKMADLQGYLRSIAKQPVPEQPSTISLKEAQALKEEIGKVANWRNKLQISDKEKMARDAYGVVSQHIDDAVSKGSDAIDRAGLSDMLSEGKSLYSHGSDAAKLLENKLAREQGNKLLGLTDWGVLGSGAAASIATGGAAALPTLAVLGAKKGAEKYGAKVGARSLDAISEKLMQSPQIAAAYQKNPAVVQNLIQRMESQISPQQFPRAADAPDESAKNFNKTHDKGALIQKTQGTKYAQVLQNAANNGDQSFNAAHFVLQQRDPEYRKLTEEGTP